VRFSQEVPARGRRPQPNIIRDENVYTSAGVTAGMDLAWLSWRKTMARGSRCKWRATSCFICAGQEDSRNLALL